MVYVLKVILGILAIAMGLSIRFIYRDFDGVRKSEGYDELSVWEKLRFNFTFFSMFTGIASLIVFLIYFIITKITIG